MTDRMMQLVLVASEAELADVRAGMMGLVEGAPMIVVAMDGMLAAMPADSPLRADTERFRAYFAALAEVADRAARIIGRAEITVVQEHLQ
jgi:predicted regulator of Ras-like GTPase activity (Roadblock/LC7/MglB family)